MSRLCRLVLFRPASSVSRHWRYPLPPRDGAGRCFRFISWPLFSPLLPLLPRFRESPNLFTAASGSTSSPRFTKWGLGNVVDRTRSGLRRFSLGRGRSATGPTRANNTRSLEGGGANFNQQGLHAPRKLQRLPRLNPKSDLALRLRIP